MRERARDSSGIADGRASSASATTAPSPTHLSEGHGRLRFGGGRPLGRSSKKSALSYSDFHAERIDASAEDGEVSEGGRGGRRTVVASGAGDPSAHFLGQRSVSLTALHPGQTCYGSSSQILLEPRMAQLETLEAKMASIEVSLSVTPRRRRTPSQSGVSTPTAAPPSAPPTPLGDRGIRSFPSKTSLTSASPRPMSRALSAPSPTPVPSPLTSNTSTIIIPPSNASDHGSIEIDSLKKTLREKENVIQSLKQQLGRWPVGSDQQPWEHISNGTKGSIIGKGIAERNGETMRPPLSKEERSAAERKLRHLRQDIETRRRAIRGLQASLAALHVTDNIDVRIQQAELEFSLGREELELLTLLEQTRNLQAAIEESDEALTSHSVRQQIRGLPGSTSLYWCLKEGGSSRWEIKATEVNVDLRRPSFSVVTKRRSSEGSKPGLFVEWASSSCPLSHGDRIIEVNGESVIGSSSEEIRRILGAVSGNICVVVLRRIHPTRRTEMGLRKEETTRDEELVNLLKKERETLKGENLRLTHRISYLEEQVTELQNGASCSDTSKDSIPNSQKGLAQSCSLSSILRASDKQQSKHEDKASDTKSSQSSGSERSGKNNSQDINSHSNHIVPGQGPRPPVPPKKPLRLSLPRATSLQSVESLPADTSLIINRKPTKRNHRGEPPTVLVEMPQPPPRASSRADSCHSVSSAPSRHHHNSHRLSMDSQSIYDAISQRTRKEIGEKWC